MPLIENDRGLGRLVAATEAERLVTGLQFTEGPVWAPDGALLFTDIPGDRIHRWNEADGLTVWREPSGNANGLTLDAAGRLIACEHGNRRVSRSAPDGTVVPLAVSWQDRRLNSPNDAVVASSGAIYFTDPPYGVAGPDRQLDFQGVYRLDPPVEGADPAEPVLLVEDFNKPNGLALSPDESVLYVDDTDEAHIRSFDVRPDGNLAAGRVFARFDPALEGAADGMKVDEEGRVYCTGPGGCSVFEPDGSLLGRIVLPEPPANVAWGGDGYATLYFTARSSLYRLPMNVAGADSVARRAAVTALG